MMMMMMMMMMMINLSVIHWTPYTIVDDLFMVEVHLSGTHDIGSWTCLIRLKNYKSCK